MHILDPFTGTGTFLVRLLLSGLIRPEDLVRKYRQELHANKIVLLAYYLAATNMEQTFHVVSGQDYRCVRHGFLQYLFKAKGVQQIPDKDFPLAEQNSYTIQPRKSP